VLQVKFRCELHTAWVSAETRNIGVGGAFIVTPLIQQVGTPITLALTLPATDRAFTLPSIVRWATAGPDGGMGV